MRDERGRDVNRDGYADGVAQFRANEAGLEESDEEACLTGDLLGRPFLACQPVEVEGSACGLGFELVLPLLQLVRSRRRMGRAA